MKFKRVGRHVYRDPRWPVVRLEAKRRDGWRCVQCDARGRLEVDHIKPIRTHPELAFDLDNLQTLCGGCHAKKTRIEVGMGNPNPERDKWLRAIDDLRCNRQ